MSLTADGPRGRGISAREKPAKQSNLVSSTSISSTAGKSSSRAKEQTSVSSFHQHLSLGGKKQSSVKSSISSLQKSRQKVSIAPIFSLQPKITKNGQSRPAWRESSPDADPDVLIRRLKKHYQENAETLHKKAATQLRQAHSDLSHKLRGTLKGETAFLAAIEKQNKTLCSPLSQLSIRSQELDRTSGQVRTSTSSVGDLVSNTEAHLSKFEADLSRLWAEWEDAEREVEKVHRESLPDQDGHESPDDDTARYGDTLARFRTAIQEEIDNAEGEVVQLGEAAIAMMKEIEKDYRRDTVQDLHLFFKSIDEP